MERKGKERNEKDIKAISPFRLKDDNTLYFFTIKECLSGSEMTLGPSLCRNGIKNSLKGLSVRPLKLAPIRIRLIIFRLDE